ncbi:helix-turn-helix domain-containing protein [Rhizobium ruizarguesonis]
MARLNGNRKAAATLLGMHRTTLRQKMRRYGLDG